jgi:hypothetical protein
VFATASFGCGGVPRRTLPAHRRADRRSGTRVEH